MNRGIYSAAIGMAAAQRQLDVLSNNLANSSTTGYKRDELVFNDMFAREIQRPGVRGAGVGSLSYGPTNFSEQTVTGELGEVRATGNPLDVAITSQAGFFAVRSADGQVRYTRDGSFARNSEGLLVTQRGEPVLNEQFAEISVADGRPEVLDNGTVQVDGSEVGKLGIFDGQLRKAGANLFEGSPRLTDEFTLKPGALEGSNVNVIREMTEMISLNRTFEISQRSIMSQDDLSQRLIQSLQDR